MTRNVVKCAWSMLMVAVVSGSVWGQQLPPEPPDGGVPMQLVLRGEGVEFTLSLGSGDPFHRTPNRVENERLIEVPESPVRLVTWTEISPSGRSWPYYAISLDGETVATVRRTSYVLKIREGDYDPLAARGSEEVTAVADMSSNLYIVQFVTQPLDEFRADIEQLGGIVHQFLANHAHFVRMSPDVREAVAALPYVRWVGAVQPSMKLEDVIRQQLSSGESVEPRRYSIMMHERGPAAQSRVAAVIESLGSEVHGTTPQGFRMEATLPIEHVSQIAALDDVMFIDRKGEIELDTDIVRQRGGADYIESVAGYTGQGVRGEVADTELDTSHREWSDPPIIHVSGGGTPHGTSVYGILFAQGEDPQARGLIPDGVGIFANSTSLLGGGTTRYTRTAELVDPDGPYRAVFQTNSTGDPRTFSYTSISAEMDDILFINDITVTQSQSNAGSQASRPQAWAKNVVSGGAVYHYDTFTRDDDCWCFSGSIGPAEDGRIKPDLCFFYDATYAPSAGGGYTQFGGTSGATPSIAGHFGLFYQMWGEGIFGNEDLIDPEGTVFDNRAHMTTAKAVLINTANAYPFSGTTHDLTRVHQGWGNPDLQYLYDMRENISIIDETEIIENLETLEFTAFVEPDEPAMRVTMVYADPMGVPSSSQHRINDLTLKLTSPSDEVYWGNHGLHEGNWSVPGGEANTIDTVENVFIEAPEPGVWTVEIIASEINEDGHVETPEMDADFALVTSGAFLATCTSQGRLLLKEVAYGCSSPVEVRVVDCDLNTDETVVDTVEVRVHSATEPNGESIVLTETAPETADFRGIIQLGSDDEDGVLQVVEGDEIVATYLDADDGEGGVDIEVTALAVIDDCRPPVIDDVNLFDIEPYSATVTFTSDEEAVGAVRFGFSCDALTGRIEAEDFATDHTVYLTGLQHGSTYFYAAEAKDAKDNVGIDDASGACYVFATPLVILDDDFEFDQNWTVESVDLVDGAWQRGIPAGDGSRNDPPFDYDNSGQCFVTANRAGNSDVDGGPTRLISPVLDLSRVGEPVLRYARWFGNDDLDSDRLVVEVSDDDGATWTPLETVPPRQDPLWQVRTYVLEDYVELTSEVRVRFSVWDNPNNSITEAGVDFFRVISFEYITDGDLDGDYDVDMGDMAAFQACFNQPAAGGCEDANLAGGDVIDMADFAAFAAALDASGPG